MTAGQPEPLAERVLGYAPARSRAALPSGAPWLRVLPWLIAWPALVAMGVARRRRAGGAARLGMVVLAAIALAACAVVPEEQPAAQEAQEVDAEPAEEPEARPREEPEEPEPQPPAEPEPPAEEPEPEPVEPDGELAVHFLDVGQGDATLLVADGAAVLVDAGRHDRDDVLGHLARLDVEALDVVIVTHPHADHIGQFDKVLVAVDVAEVSSTTHNFE